MAEVTYHVNVCDIDSPWEVHRLTSSQDAIVLMRWDSSATKLLLITALGKCQVWEMKVRNNRTDENLSLPKSDQNRASTSVTYEERNEREFVEMNLVKFQLFYFPCK